MDVKSTFQNETLEEEIYVLQQPDFKVKGEEHNFYKLINALYGLKMAPRARNNRIDVFLQ